MKFLTDIQAVSGIFIEQAKDLLPFFVASILFAAFVKTFKWDRRIRASIVKYPRSSIIIATIAGIISPLCSCGILPVVVALSGAGVPIPPVMALLITSPIMSPDSLIITAAEMGISFAVGKIIVAISTGLFTGFLCHYLVGRSMIPEFPFRKVEFEKGLAGGKKNYQEIVDAGCFSHSSSVPTPRPGSFVFFLERARDMTVITGKFLLIALLIQAGVNYYVPSNMVEGLLGNRSINSVLLATVISVPLPIHQMVAPSVLKAFISMGLSPGAAMAVLTGGPVTSIPAMGLLAGLYQKKTLLLYMLIGISVTITAGYVYQFFV